MSSDISYHSLCIVTEQYLYCLSAFATRATAIIHVSNAVEPRVCNLDLAYRRKEPSRAVCLDYTVGDFIVQDLRQLSVYLRVRIPRPHLQVRKAVWPTVWDPGCSVATGQDNETKFKNKEKDNRRCSYGPYDDAPLSPIQAPSGTRAPCGSPTQSQETMLQQCSLGFLPCSRGRTLTTTTCSRTRPAPGRMRKSQSGEAGAGAPPKASLETKTATVIAPATTTTTTGNSWTKWPTYC